MMKREHVPHELIRVSYELIRVSYELICVPEYLRHCL